MIILVDGMIILIIMAAIDMRRDPQETFVEMTSNDHGDQAWDDQPEAAWQNKEEVKVELGGVTGEDELGLRVDLAAKVDEGLEKGRKGTNKSPEFGTWTAKVVEV